MILRMRSMMSSPPNPQVRISRVGLSQSVQRTPRETLRELESRYVSYTYLFNQGGRRQSGH